MTKRSLTHFNQSGNAIMVDVSAKKTTSREAMATDTIFLSREGLLLVQEGRVVKGDVLGVARLAGIMAAKKVDQLIPLTHPLNITKAEVDFSFDEEKTAINIWATVAITGQTGVEMEALTAVSIAALTIYDMCKSVDKYMTIGNIQLEKKTGGKSGTFIRTK
nr:cyclic pyranopterin monophosphate synthase MoaC [Desulfobulbaceae bacterium]